MLGEPSILALGHFGDEILRLGNNIVSVSKLTRDLLLLLPRVVDAAGNLGAEPTELQGFPGVEDFGNIDRFFVRDG